jgi:Cof subfamily protein (haloacid dehalogenase superfamily)
LSKVFVTDLDHTFLRNDLTISSYTKNVWNSLASTYILSVATARTFKKANQFLKGIIINAPMILLDGAYIVTPNEKVLDKKVINKEVGDEIIAIGSKSNFFPFVLSLEKNVVEETFLVPQNANEVQKKLLKNYVKEDNIQIIKDIKSLDENFKFVYMGTKEQMENLKTEMYDVFGDFLKYILAPEVYMNCYFLTLLHKDADKANGLLSISEYSGVDLKDFSVFGDNLNDMGMFKAAGKSIAVNNSHIELKEYASITLPHTNDEDGVARYLESIHKV